MQKKWLEGIEERKEEIISKVREVFVNIAQDSFDADGYKLTGGEGKEFLGCPIFEFIYKALEQAPEYFWTRASSTSGKYHPSDEFCEGGLVLHTCKCLIMAEEMLRGVENIDWVTKWITEKQLSGTVVENQKIFIGAIVLHDLYASGLPGQEKYRDGVLSTDPLHMLYVRQACKDIELEDIELESFPEKIKYAEPAHKKHFFNAMMMLIEGHYGPWSPNPQVKPNNKFAELVYYIDYFASRSFVNIDVEG